MTHSFLLEIGLEDMPAGVIVPAEKQLVEKTKAFLKQVHLTFGEVTSFSTPRRLAIIVNDLAEKQADQNLTVRGPAERIAKDEDGNWTKAAIGFSKGQGGTVEDIIVKDEDGEPYIYIEKHVPGKQASELLKDLSTVIKDIEFPKNMKWGTTNYQYVRPIHWLVALLDEKVIPFEVFDVQTGQKTEGHRFLGNATTIQHPNEYQEKLKDEFVLANRTERKQLIMEQITNLCAENDWEVPRNYPNLLEEVTDLVEYPTAFYGSFADSYLEVPEVVLETSMIDHQRYFPVRKAGEDNELLPYFISVRNGNQKHIDNVARGNEKVLSARLADSKFFYDEDQKSTIEDFLERLKRVDYHEQLGTLFEKQERAYQMVTVLADAYNLDTSQTKQLKRVTEIYKFDLVTQVVDEFPTLQGTIGEIYALEREEEPDVAAAIGEQYHPLSGTDALPETPLGIYIALLDKLDTLIQFFSIGEIPTGSNDPYALRRQAIGVVRMLLALNHKALNLNQFIDDLVIASELPVSREEDLDRNKAALMHFIKDRLEQIMATEYQINHDVRQAALGSTHNNVSWMLDVAQILEEEKENPVFKEVVEAITRVINITDKQTTAGKIQENLFASTSEKVLADEIKKLENVFAHEADVEKRYHALEEMHTYITDFFDHNMIMVKDEAIKGNRLTLLHKLATIAKEFADFSQLVI
jgi:glycyl-tRNA synthetase beta chain